MQHSEEISNSIPIFIVLTLSICHDILAVVGYQ